MKHSSCKLNTVYLSLILATLWGLS